eukprot:Gregarina_sp_Poly_1__1337@NODE_132_length_13232_cov_209_776377_g118_i0_p7_GENE_NODE_132_length_13232_cov_209_776377_g118_i0NODE_132_length_13232_cov_209_776377_g118_i0_p7_ORF_typecomplete_len294_score40_57Orbi_NS3/PF01616_16/0_054Chorion_2/PF03964_15/1_2_NODE_132_length_13232_cov_209_776377_g118_i01229713178
MKRHIVLTRPSQESITKTAIWLGHAAVSIARSSDFDSSSESSSDSSSSGGYRRRDSVPRGPYQYAPSPAAPSANQQAAATSMPMSVQQAFALHVLQQAMNNKMMATKAADTSAATYKAMTDAIITNDLLRMSGGRNLATALPQTGYLGSPGITSPLVNSGSPGVVRLLQPTVMQSTMMQPTVIQATMPSPQPAAPQYVLANSAQAFNASQVPSALLVPRQAAPVSWVPFIAPATAPVDLATKYLVMKMYGDLLAHRQNQDVAKADGALEVASMLLLPNSTQAALSGALITPSA